MGKKMGITKENVEDRGGKKAIPENKQKGNNNATKKK